MCNRSTFGRIASRLDWIERCSWHGSLGSLALCCFQKVESWPIGRVGARASLEL